MLHTLNPYVAQRVGINAALVAQLLYEELDGYSYKAQRKTIKDKTWVRISYPELAAVMGCMSVDMVSTAIHRLLKARIVKCAQLSDDRFDHANWYLFTDLGDQVMHSVPKSTLYPGDDE